MKTQKVSYELNLPTDKELVMNDLSVIRTMTISIRWWLVGIFTVAVCILMTMVLYNNGVSTDAAKCTSLGGVYSTQNHQCYYGGKSIKVNDLMKRQGVK